jgi:hypothetical protein
MFPVRYEHHIDLQSEAASSTRPRRPVTKLRVMKAYGQWRYRSMCSRPRHEMLVSGQFLASGALSPRKEPPIQIG